MEVIEPNATIKSTYARDYYKKNKDYWYERIRCNCGGIYMRANRSRHVKTKIHLNHVKISTDKETKKKESMDMLRDVICNKTRMNDELIAKLVTDIWE